MIVVSVKQRSERRGGREGNDDDDDPSPGRRAERRRTFLPLSHKQLWMEMYSAMEDCGMLEKEGAGGSIFTWTPQEPTKLATVSQFAAPRDGEVSF